MKSVWSPMLLSEQDKPFESKDFLYEIKWDGYRALVYLSKTKTVLISRNGKDITNTFPELKNLHKRVNSPCVIDGEIIALDSFNKPSFALLQGRSIMTKSDKINKMAQSRPAKLMAFDILKLNNKDCINLPLLERKKILKETVKENEFVQLSDYIFEYGTALFEKVKEEQLEGIVAKRANSKYKPNTRTKDWIKIKNVREQNFTAVATVWESGAVKYLILAKKEKSSWKLIDKLYCPNTHDKEYLKKISIQNKGKALFETNLDNIHWLKTPIQVTVSYLELTKTGHMRAAVYRGIVKGRNYKSCAHFKENFHIMH